MSISLRDFIQKVKEQGKLVTIDRKVDLKYDVGKVLMKAYHNQKGPVVLFTKPGESDMPLVANIFSSRDNAALALGVPLEKLNGAAGKALETRVKPQIVTNAPSQEVIIQGDDVDLNKYPIPIYSPDDGGAYVTPGIVVSKDPETGVYDMGHYRFMRIGKNTFSFLAQPFHRFGENIIKAKKLGVPLEAALVIGSDPALGFAAQAKVGASDDYEVAGGFLGGEPLKVTKGKTIDLLVPASAEVIFELQIDYNKLVPEGPLGEYTGYYTPTSPKPVATVKAITQRKNPIFQALLTGKPAPVTENHILKEIPFEASLYKQLKANFPTLKDVSIPPFGGVQAVAIASFTPRFYGESVQLLTALISSFVVPKWAIVVDTDIDVFDINDVMWALSFRTNPARDIIKVRGITKVPLDPSAELGEHEKMTSTSIGIDATLLHEGFTPAKVATVPDWESFKVPELD